MEDEFSRDRTVTLKGEERKAVRTDGPRLPPACDSRKHVYTLKSVMWWLKVHWGARI